MLDERSITALDIAEKYARGLATKEELGDAEYGAAGAAYDAAYDAAGAAQKEQFILIIS